MEGSQVKGNTFVERKRKESQEALKPS